MLPWPSGPQVHLLGLLVEGLDGLTAKDWSEQQLSEVCNYAKKTKNHTEIWHDFLNLMG